MKQFIIKTLKIAFLFYVLFWAIQLVVDQGLRLSKNEKYNEWNKIIKGKINADVVFLGSSRTYKHFNPKVFDKKLKKNTYNLGNNGISLDLQAIRNKAYFSNNTNPKIIIQNVDITCLNKTKELYNKPQYFPYYTLDNYKILSELDANVTLEYFIPIYKYRGFLNVFIDAYNGYLGKEENTNHVYKGFSASGSVWNHKFENEKKKLKGKKFDFSTLNLSGRYKVLENLIENLKQTNAKVFLVWSPEYYERQELNGKTQQKVLNSFKRIAEQKKVVFLDFTKDSLCLSKDYFYDSYHLNGKGANLFSNKVADSIKKYLRDKTPI